MKRSLFVLPMLTLLACGDDNPCEKDPCFEGVTCTATGDTRTCGPCPTGYSGDGDTCTDQNGCAGDPCADGVTCTDVRAPGVGFMCGACPPGQTGDGITCTSTMDDCAATPCAPGVTCTDLPPPMTFECGPCPSGQAGDGVTCTDIDGCEGDPCFAGVTCTDIPAPGEGFSCGACPAGYQGDGVSCTDVDGCAANPCAAGVTCTDVAAPGEGFTCGPCPTGQSGDGVTCTEVDGCAANPCAAGVTCTDVPSPGEGFTCGPCPPGQSGDGVTCAETDGCATNPCFAGVTCTDVPAPGEGFSCGACPTGYDGDGISCTDTDACALTPCAPGVTCSDVPAPGTGFSCGPCPTGQSGDGVTCAEIDGCAVNPCFSGVSCSDVPSPGEGFSCGPCPTGYGGDGVTCTDVDECIGTPCLSGTTCTDVPAPGTGFTCTPCTGPGCPFFRALAGPDQTIIAGTVATLSGDAVDYNGAFTCRWTNNQDATVLTTCTATVSPVVQTIYTLEVTDASSQVATDTMTIRIVELIADAGPSQNINSTETATLSASWAGASCPDTSCISCEWRTSGGTLLSSTCNLVVSPAATTQYFLTVTDTIAARSATDSTTVYITDLPAQLCGWNVVVMTSNEYPSAPNPNYICEAGGIARRQTVNGKPAIVLSDLVVSNTRIVGYIGVETTADDDLIGFLWGWQNPAHAYLLTWKQINQTWTAACGNAMAGIAVKKIDAAPGAATTISFNPSFGYNATDFVYSCAIGWSTDRNNSALLGTSGSYLLSPRDAGAFTTGWRDNITYRFEFYYTPSRTRILVYEDDAMTGSTTTLVTTVDVVDSTYPEGQFAFFSNSQEQVAFGDFTLASLDGFRADAGLDQTISAGGTATLTGSAELAVPPYGCEWSDGTATVIGTTCTLPVMPAVTSTYSLTVTDAFGRVTGDDTVVIVGP